MNKIFESSSWEIWEREVYPGLSEFSVYNDRMLIGRDFSERDAAFMFVKRMLEVPRV